MRGFAISLIEFSIWSRISDELVTALAWDMDDHSESEGRSSEDLPSFHWASEIVLDEDIATGISFSEVKICFSDEQTCPFNTSSLGGCPR